MTTFVDPLGVYASSKTGITSMAASSGMPYAEIPHDAGWMVAVVSGTGHVTLPPGSNVGDIVEIYATSGNVTAHGQSGESVVNTGEVQQGYGSFFRKISSSLWARTT